MPPTALSYVGGWPTGEIGCKFTQYLITVLMYVSIYTLVLLSLDRYLAVVYPVKSISIRTGRNTGLGLSIIYRIHIEYQIIFDKSKIIGFECNDIKNLFYISAILFVWVVTLSSCTPTIFLHTTHEVPLTVIFHVDLCDTFLLY